MKRFIRLSILIGMAIILLPSFALASDISDALYHIVITIGNSGDAAQTVSTVADISSPSLIAGEFANDDVTNVAMRDAAGEDIAFMPGYDTNPWVMFVPSIGANAFTTYRLYTAESTGGKIRYFPDSAGMTIADDDSLEPADDFEIEFSGYVDTSATDPASEILRPNAVGDVTQLTPTGAANNWDCVDETPTDEDTTYVSVTSATKYDLYNLPAHSESGLIKSIEVFIRAKRADAGDWARIMIKTGGIEYDNGANLALGAAYADFSHVWATNPDTGELWTWDDIDSLQIGVKLSEGFANWARCTQVYVEVNIWKPLLYKTDAIEIYISGEEEITAEVNGGAASVTAPGVPSDEHTVNLTYDGADLTIIVDEGAAGEITDTTPWVGSVTGNDKDWIIGSDATPYIEYYSHTVSGDLMSYIEWEYDNIFHDQSDNGIHENDATPTFRTTSSDADVTAEATSLNLISEAKAPPFVLGETTPWLTDVPPITGDFTTVVTPTYPGAEAIQALADASGTPSQLPFTILAAFIILAISLAYSSFLRRGGSGSLLVKSFLIAGCMGIAIATKTMDFWMLLFFVFFAVALAMASQQRSWS